MKKLITLSLFLFAFTACSGDQITQTETEEEEQKDTTPDEEEELNGDPYTWPEYSPNIEYDFRDDYGDVPMPENVLDDCEGVVGTQSSEWWTFRWGSTANSLVTSDAITPMLERFNTDFAYFREMGWPPDLRARNGYKSTIYLFGSNLCTDDEPNTALGGWQSAVYYDGTWWPMVLASYYPVYSFDPASTYSDKEFQKGAMIHEGIHSILASMPGVKSAGWFHEGGNTWLQQTADSERSGDYSSMGFLSGAAMIAPFMPIESYSGWLQDGSFGGPNAQGVNMYEGSQQINTWRNFLGGNQYGNTFPTFLGLTLGEGSIPWIWKYAESTVLEGIADGIGSTQIRRLITEYRAKQAVVDFGVWTEAVIGLLDASMGMEIGTEWEPYHIDVETWIATPYAQTMDDGSGELTPEYRTTPGWSGANQIPLTVSDSTVTVEFLPQDENMRLQLAYIATDGSRVYSQIVSEGKVALDLEKPPANEVIIAVVSNTNYIYEGEATRTAHFDYRLQLVSGISGTADIHTPWYKGTDLTSMSLNSLERATMHDHPHTGTILAYCRHNLSPPENPQNYR
ncbi:MAG: hypothetical protein WDZ29_05410 [Balneolaceae bacterium]